MDDNIGYVLKKLEDMGQLVVDEGVKSCPGAVREIWPPPVEKKLRNDVRLIANSIIGVALAATAQRSCCYRKLDASGAQAINVASVRAC
jgi:hypothetical protein